MPLVTSVIDDKSPLILYDDTWLPGTGQDPFAPDYYRGTFTTNNVTGGAVTFNFNGTSVWVYGANRPNHGSFSVQVDGATFSAFNGQGNNLFQQVLFNDSLSQSAHTLELTNTASNSLYIDIDMIVWQSEVGSLGDQLTNDIIQDTDPRFSYQEPAWGTTSSTTDIDLHLFDNGTGHITQTYNATVTFTFTGACSLTHLSLHSDSWTGEAVSIFGSSGPVNGPYSAQLDSGTPVRYNATTMYPTNYGMMIFHADNLGPGQHQVVLTNLPASSGQVLAIDHAQLWTITNDTATIKSANSGSSASSGAIAGIAITAAIAALSTAAAVFFFWRWRTALATQDHLHRAYTSQQRPPDPSGAPPSAFSSALDTRSTANIFRNDTTVPVQQPVNILATQSDRSAHMAIDSRDSHSIIALISSPALSDRSVDDAMGSRPLPEAPGGGLRLSAEFPKLAVARAGPSTVSDVGSIAGSDVPPNYVQATRVVAGT